ncbi:hypothetical protein JZU51_02075 [bacterium]|nr:hypothetical protein [bacterium]
MAPGRFDTLGSSHQIFHVAILCATYTHVVGLLQGFTTSQTPDMCQVQSVLKTGQPGLGTNTYSD